jgi:DNA-binding response OmpR family regulator
VSTSGMSLSILILDDDVRFLSSFEDLLLQDGHAVYSATRARDAVEIARRVPLDLSFLDFDLQDQNGIEVCVRIHRQRPQLPVIFISGNPSGWLERLVLESGGSAFLRKPFDASVVRGVVREVIDRNNSSRS